MTKVLSVSKRELCILSLIIALIVASSITLFITREQRSDAFTRINVHTDAHKYRNKDDLLKKPAPFVDSALSLHAPAVTTPLRLQIPAVGIDADVLGVGLTPKKNMDAPMGKASNPDWQQAFWYRGSAIPGELSTALIAGHVDDPLGRPGVFAHLDSVIVGDEIVVHDNRTGLDVTFGVTEIKTYTLKETKNSEILDEIYGTGPVSGQAAQPSSDGLAHLTLITCAGVFSNKLGTHDHRLVVYATRIS